MEGGGGLCMCCLRSLADGFRALSSAQPLSISLSLNIGW